MSQLPHLMEMFRMLIIGSEKKLAEPSPPAPPRCWRSSPARRRSRRTRRPRQPPRRPPPPPPRRRRPPPPPRSRPASSRRSTGLLDPRAGAGRRGGRATSSGLDRKDFELARGRPSGALPGLRAARRGALEPGLPAGPLGQHGRRRPARGEPRGDPLLPRPRPSGRRVRARELRQRRDRRSTCRSPRTSRRCARRIATLGGLRQDRAPRRRRPGCRRSRATAATSSARPS